MKQKLLIYTITLFTVFIMVKVNYARNGASSNSNNVITSEINTQKSYIDWVGKKVLGQHNGRVKVKSGNIISKNGILGGGSFIIDMSSITCTDIADEKYNAKLIGHLNSEDFFNVDEFQTAELKITKVLKVTGKENSYNLSAVLTIKGISNTITFPAIFKSTGKGFEGNATITIDRTLWDIKYGSSNFFEGLGDKAIKNEIELTVYVAS